MSLPQDVYQIIPLNVPSQGQATPFATLEGGKPSTVATVIAPPSSYGKGVWEIRQLENGKYTIATQDDPRIFAVCEKNVPPVEGLYPNVVGDTESEEWEIEFVSGEIEIDRRYRIKRDGLCWCVDDGIAGDVGLPISLRPEDQGNGKNLWRFNLARLGHT